MNNNASSRAARSRHILAVLAFAGASALLPAAVSAADCGGVLSPTTGNVVGTLAGAAAGGLIGNQFGKGTGQGVMTGLGVVGGGLAGGYVGRQVEGCGRTPQSAGGGAPRAVGGGQAVSADGRICRYVLTQAVIDGREQQINGVACQGPDGTWRTASDPAAQRAADTDMIFRAQQVLHDQGYYVQKNIDGRWGPATSTAVRNYQRANGLQASGQLDLPTQQAMQIGPTPVMAQAAQPPVPVQAPPPALPAGTPVQVRQTQ